MTLMGSPASLCSDYTSHSSLNSDLSMEIYNSQQYFYPVTSQNIKPEPLEAAPQPSGHNNNSSVRKVPSMSDISETDSHSVTLDTAKNFGDVQWKKRHSNQMLFV